MKFEDAARHWAASKVGCNANQIKTVHFDIDEGMGGGCDTCGYGADETEIEVTVRFTGARRPQTLAYSTWSFSELLEELCSVAHKRKPAEAAS